MERHTGDTNNTGANSTGDVGSQTLNSTFNNMGKVKARDIIISTGLNEQAVEKMLKGLTDRLVKEMSAIDKNAAQSSGSIKELIENEVIGRLCAIEERQATTEKDAIKAIKEEFSALQKNEIVRNNLIDDVMAQLRGQMADNRSFAESIQALCERAAQNANRQYEQFKAWQEKRVEAVRANLSRETHREHPDKDNVKNSALAVLELIPNDFLAQFYLAVYHREYHDAVKFINEIDVRQYTNNELKEAICFLTKHAREEWILPTSALIERTSAVWEEGDDLFKREIRDPFEKKVDGFTKGLYNVTPHGRVFVAYNNEDVAKVSELVSYLEASSSEIKCFVAFRNIRNGTNAEEYNKILSHALKYCSVFVLYSTHMSRTSGGSYEEMRQIIEDDYNSAQADGHPEYARRGDYKGLPPKYKKPRIEYKTDKHQANEREGLSELFFGNTRWRTNEEELRSRILEILHGGWKETEPEPAPTVAPESKPERKVISYANGDVYDGEVKDGKGNGHGVYRSADGDVFEGEYKDGKRNGHGVYRSADGDVFEGEYKDGKRNGHGVYRTADGDEYEGEFKDDKFNGHGVYRTADGDEYEGEWKDDSYTNGHGVYRSADGDVFEGEFKDGKRNGHGVLRFADGDVFEGEYKDDEANGHGVYRYADGAVFECEYKDGKANGRGVYRSADGDVLEDEWEEGHLKGQQETGNQQKQSLASTYPTLENYDKTEFEIEGTVLKRYKGESSEVKIPLGVTEIGDFAFTGCSSLTSIEIPNSVTSIEEGVFSECSSLKRIEVTEGNPVYHSAGNCLIETKSKTLIAGCKTSIIPKDGSVTSIGDSAFSRCTSLTNIVIPDSVKSIEGNVFAGCSSLKRIKVAKGNPVYHCAGNCLIETKSKTLIAGCKTSIIPKNGSVTSIGEYAFYGCDSLTSIVIPDGVKSIGLFAFAFCRSLKSIVISNSVTLISFAALDCCDALESIEVALGNPVYHSAGNCLIATKTKKLIWGCKTSIIPNDWSVTSIGDSAFSRCTSLTNIVIPKSVTSIGAYAFSYCTSLTNIVIPKSVTSIGDSVFTWCNSLAIYCGAAEKPSGWGENWNPDNRPVVWGYKE